MYTLATLTALRQHLGIAESEVAPIEDQRLRLAIQAASKWLERLAGRRFSPYRAVLRHAVDPARPTQLALHADLLELLAVEDASGGLDLAQIIVAEDGTLIYPAGFDAGEMPRWAVAVTGIWGTHDDWSQAWRSSGDALSAACDAAATQLSVSDVSGADAYQQTPRFQVGQLIRLGDEYLRVVAICADTQRLSVLRGQQGTSAAAHDAATSIDIYQPADDLVLLCLRLATWFYREPDSLVGDTLPPSLAGAMSEALAGLRRLRVG